MTSEAPDAPLSMTILTPSYARDRELCKDLVDTVDRFTGPDVKHVIIVPRGDVASFAAMSGTRTVVHSVADYLPPWLVKVPLVNGWVNLRRPFPPVRGWIAQQIVKLSAAASSDSDLILLTDSDVVFFRPIDAQTFVRADEIELFRVPDAIDPSLPRHVLWHAAARRLLGLPPSQHAVLPDYIGWPCAWRPSIVRDMLDRVQQTTGVHWTSAISRELHFSEMILYGVYVEEIVRTTMPVDFTSEIRCLNHSDEIRLSLDDLRAIFSTARENDFAMMISAKSGTPLDVRREFLAELRAR